MSVPEEECVLLASRGTCIAVAEGSAPPFCASYLKGPTLRLQATQELLNTTLGSKSIQDGEHVSISNSGVALGSLV